jgi:predicted DNA-binding ribbon-helix-helix protein
MIMTSGVDTGVVKRSIVISGRRTSISLEDEFWSEVKRIAAKADMSAAAFIAHVNQHRTKGNLSSALRLAVLADLQTSLANAGGQTQAVEYRHDEEVA